MPDATSFSLGLDFGTESVRALLVNIADGSVAALAEERYEHGVIDRALPGKRERLPPDYALQDPQDWLDSCATAVRAARRMARCEPSQITGIGVDFTSCTMLPCLADGTPLCIDRRFGDEPLAWPKLWKHHGAKAETDRFNRIAAETKQGWLARYGGTIGLEWFFPKVLESLNHAPRIYAAAEVWLEAGDWLVWQLVDGPFPNCDAKNLIRSTCQAGYKACWNHRDGFPSRGFFTAVHPKLRDIGKKLPGEHRAPPASARACSLLALRSCSD